MKLFSSTSLDTQLKLLVLIPIVMLALFAGNQIKREYSLHHDAEMFIDLAYVVSDISKLIHLLQIERGVSCGYAESNGELFGAKIVAARAQMNQQLSHVLKTFSSSTLVQNFRNNPQELQHVLQRVEDVRAKIDFLEVGCNDLFPTFDELIADMLMLINVVQGSLHASEFNQPILTYDLFLQYKNLVGKERGLANGLLAKGHATKEQIATMHQLVGEQRLALELMMSYADDLERFEAEAMMNSDVVSSSRQFRRQIISSLEEGTTPPITAEAWFDSMTQVVEMLNSFEGHLFEHVLEVARALETEAEESLSQNLVTLLLSLLLMIYFIRTIQLEIQRRTSPMQRYMEELSSKTGELQQLQDALSQHAIVSVTDPKGNILDVNEQFCQISGFSYEELIGQNHRIVRSDTHSEAFYKDLWSTITAGKVWQGEINNAVKNSSDTYWVKATIVPFYDESREISKFISIRTDITENKLNETRLAQQNHALEKAREEVEQASQAKGEFLASMSHELRTPLTAIIGNGEILADTPLTPDQRQLLGSIVRSGEHQLSLVNDILDMSKISSGKFDIDHAPFDLSALLEDVEDMFTLRAKDTGIGFEIDQRVHPQCQIFGDAQRIHQILLNFLSNAFKFTDAGGVLLKCDVEGEEIYFSVEDSGIGMSEELIQRLFQPFEQADNKISTRYGGTGLGLYISSSLAELMGGSVAVRSQPGEGSCFTLRLPYQESEVANAVDKRSGAGRSVGATDDEQLFGHVLIAEDTPELQLLETRIVESMGPSVTLANNGQEAIDLVKQQHFDLVLMDMQMPVLDGLQATQQIRESGSAVPIAAITANVMQKHREQFYQAGIDDFLQKPIDKQELRKVLQRHLTASKSESAQSSEVDDELMAVFVQSSEQRKDALVAALSVKDWGQVRELAHAIKGSAVSFGYPALSEKAASLEQDIDQDQLDAVGAMTMDLIIELGKVLP